MVVQLLGTRSISGGGAAEERLDCTDALSAHSGQSDFPHPKPKLLTEMRPELCAVAKPYHYDREEPMTDTH